MGDFVSAAGWLAFETSCGRVNSRMKLDNLREDDHKRAEAPVDSIRAPRPRISAKRIEAKEPGLRAVPWHAAAATASGIVPGRRVRWQIAVRENLRAVMATHLPLSSAAAEAAALRE